MAVALRRNPFGAQALFPSDVDYEQQPVSPFLGFSDVAEPLANASQESLIQPIEAAELAGDGAATGAQQEEPEIVSQAMIEHRRRLAKALMGQQQEVNHPLQAIGNAVSQISGAWMEGKAARDEQEAEKRRRDAMKAAVGDGGDLEGLIGRLLQSGDPALVDKGLEMRMQLMTSASKQRSLKPQQMIKGDQFVYVDEDGKEVPGYGGPRYRDRDTDGGGSGGGGGGRRQQGGAFQLPDGEVVAAAFNPGDGKYYYDTPQGARPVPAGARPVTPSTGGSQSPAGWLKLKKERQEGINALSALDAYAEQAGSLPQGYRRWATEIGAKWKTFLGQQGLSEEQFDQLQAPAKQQALLGMLRTTIVGPGVMTEYDAQRVIQAMGGDPRSALQNPEVMAAILEDLYTRKRSEVKVLDDEYRRIAPTFGEEYEPLPTARSIGKQPPKPGQGATPKPKLNDGDTKTINGKTYIRRGGRWFPVS